jgi:photosystem II stability/assembly factor-like uncharacterized protein
MRLLKAFGALVLASSALVAAKDLPEVHVKEWEDLPDLTFFEDSETALVVDRGLTGGTLWRTTDAGEEYSKSAGVDEGVVFMVAMHPRDNQVAIAIGVELKHWITEDQGKTWRSFVSTKPASSSEPISFHYDDPKRIMFHTFDNPRFIAGGIGEVRPPPQPVPPNYEN